MHKLDRCTVCPDLPVWLHERLDLSLKVIQPLPVCASTRIMRAYRSRAGSVFFARPVASAWR